MELLRELTSLFSRKKRRSTVTAPTPAPRTFSLIAASPTAPKPTVLIDSVGPIELTDSFPSENPFTTFYDATSYSFAHKDDIGCQRFKLFYSALSSPCYVEDLREALDIDSNREYYMEQAKNLYFQSTFRSGTPAYTDTIKNSELLILAATAVGNMLQTIQDHPSPIYSYSPLSSKGSDMRSTVRQYAKIHRTFCSAASLYVERLDWRNADEFRDRLMKRMVRKKQLDLIELVLGCVIGDLAFLVRECHTLIHMEVKTKQRPGLAPLPMFCRRHLRLLKFLATLRSESIESRIWKHIHDQEGGKTVVYTDQKSFHFKDEEPEAGLEIPAIRRMRLSKLSPEAGLEIPAIRRMRLSRCGR
ncbi:hypothetical protein BJ508DRAFT_379278 [Ascobolus immersus RN42]|uniref:Uncharacterized protein n=1 Tax=Ascobolus immersus RN42 TaxID=1160509 RepID=A0A3N4I4M7_ASCIM|nr:hypothetical protein BJ508DRAFT_379278 [Ascobolus immersus RN42]